MRSRVLIAGGLAAVWCAAGAVGAAAQKPAVKTPEAAAPKAVPLTPEMEFFETRVRPVLVEKCVACHGPKIQQAGLRLDTRMGLLKGTDGGKPGLVPGDPEKSILVQAVRYTGAVKMPPQGKLADKEIDALTQWVKMGAPWPADAGSSAAQPSAEERAKTHWAWQPVRKPAPPAVRNKAWVKSPIDQLVLAKLEAKGIAPSPAADRRTLIRRGYFDLVGLPPSPAEVDAFLADRSPDAWAKVVDHLLASPQYGERWGRYWLDVARYADTKGYVFQEERRYPFAYTYRDWVIQALNEDMPYDQFLIHQIAADQVVSGEDKSDMAAMGFLTLGRRFLNNQADIIDDRIDVLMRGTQAMTVGCARCHDHKFDPIPTKDYYSLYGVFASSMEPADQPLIGKPAQTPAYLEYEKQLNALQGDVDAFVRQKHGEVLNRARTSIAESLLAAREAAQPGADVIAIAQKRTLPAMLIRRWVTFLGDTGKGWHPVLAPWHAFAAIPDKDWGAKAPALAAKLAANADGPEHVNPEVAQAFAGAPPASLDEVAQRMARVLSAPSRDQQIEHALDSIGGPLNIEKDQVEQFLDRAERNRFRDLKSKVDKLRATSPAAPPRAMALVDAPNPVTPHVFKRGNPNNPGEEVPRQYLAVIAGPTRKPFQRGSGRLELAQMIASKDNPLTARVMANRVWMYHIGQPLVRTPSDFGLRSQPPANPELLDYLAWQFMQDGWSLKKLHRVIMLSAVYQQTSGDNPQARKVDLDNSLCWRMNRRRLDFEAMRDSLLAAAGQLDPTQGGAPVDLTAQPAPHRRTVYGFIDRQNLPGLFRTFDFASPDAHSPQRFNTSVPQQALFLMNSPFIVDQARKLTARPEFVSRSQAAEKVQELYHRVYSRAADPEEVALGLRFLKEAGALGSEAPAQKPQAWRYGYGEMDEGAGRVKSFTALPHFTGQAWQGGPALPDPKIGWVILNAAGGHPGDNLQHAGIRRWIAPHDAVIAIKGTIGHGSGRGDGIRARVVSSRSGILGDWTVQNERKPAEVARVEVKKGDTIDFIVDCRTSPTDDSYTWAPVIRVLEPAGSPAGAESEWSASAGFGGPQEPGKGLTPWEKYAQVLLMSDEFMFVD